LLKNTRKRDNTEVEIVGNIFDTDFLPEHLNGVFELPLPGNAQKLTKTKSQEKKSRMVGGWV
jgi:hypothetical protein